MTDGVALEMADLVAAADGITTVIGGLEGLGITETAAAGRGFAKLSLSPIEAGTSPVQKAMEEFAERWSWGVRNLVRAGNDIAQTLGLGAGRYFMVEQEIEGSMKTVWTDIVGNPHLSGAEITERDWSDTFADNPINNTMNPEYSLDAIQAGP